MFTLEPEDLAPYWRAIDRDLEAIDLHLSGAKSTHYAVFHCQQAVEKILKLLLTSIQIDYPRTHNIERLADLLPPNHVLKNQFDPFLDWSEYAVTPRYDFEIDVSAMSLPTVDELRAWRKSLDELYQKIQEFTNAQFKRPS